MKFTINPFKKRQKASSAPLLVDILDGYKSIIAKDFEGYRNHCLRVCQFCQTLSATPLTDEQHKKLQIALAFHDLGLFTDNTVDYLPPSMQLASEYLKKTNQMAWHDEILLMIEQHHKILSVDTSVYPLVELLRKADLVDFSLGMVTHGWISPLSSN